MKKSLEGIWHYTFEDQQMSWSPAMFGIFKPDNEGPLALTDIHRMIHPLDKFKWELAINQASLGGAPSIFDALVVLPDGKNVWLRHSVSTYLKDGNPAGIAGICTDITELKILELERKIEKHFR